MSDRTRRLAARAEQSRARLKASRDGAVLRREWNDLLRFLGLRELDTADADETADDDRSALSAQRLDALRTYLAARDDGDPVPAGVVRVVLGALLGLQIDPPPVDPQQAQRVAAAKQWLAGRLTTGDPADPATLRDVRALCILLGSLVT